MILKESVFFFNRTCFWNVDNLLHIVSSRKVLILQGFSGRQERRIVDFFPVIHTEFHSVLSAIFQIWGYCVENFSS
jgi:hypothetical protein